MKDVIEYLKECCLSIAENIKNKKEVEGFSVIVQYKNGTYDMWFESESAAKLIGLVEVAKQHMTNQFVNDKTNEYDYRKKMN